MYNLYLNPFLFYFIVDYRLEINIVDKISIFINLKILSKILRNIKYFIIK